MPTKDTRVARRRASYALEKVLLDLFAVDELRRWTRFHLPPDVDAQLPGPGASLSELAHALVLQLERRGLADDGFFDALARSFERRQDEIEAVRALFNRSCGAAPQGGAPTGTWMSDTSRQALRDRARLAGMLGLGSLGVWSFTRCYPSVDVSRAVVGIEQGVFSFLPISYRPYGLLGTAALFIACAAFFTLVTRWSRSSPTTR